ncbi:Aste57867_21862 [Aphanomyces stellatus]|uniref:Aste57867_21862 protein n=1 Tax=Aphanomyces stellatus TaxID=120398 RepID=A0A485LK04_9STRA|nr:hypothetical protein As57867_021793 [Aphanomyces stellatus]VFT98531.1 Aste57867_21862 [Aphanomyces stellatus]
MSEAAVDAVEAEWIKIAAKQKVFDKNVNDLLAAAIAEVEGAIENLKIDPNSDCEVPSLDTLLPALQKEFKDFHPVLARGGKIIDKHFVSDVAKICRPGFKDEMPTIMAMLVEHFWQSDQEDIARTLSEEANVPLPSEEFREAWTTYHRIRATFDAKDMSMAFEWIEFHRDNLSDDIEQVEFRLRRVLFIDLLRDGETPLDKILRFAQTQLAPFQATHDTDIARLMGCLLYRDNLDGSTHPYSELVADSTWSKALDVFSDMYFEYHDLPSSSPLLTIFEAGLEALPHLYKMATIVENTTKDWDTMEELPVRCVSCLLGIPRLATRMRVHLSFYFACFIFVCPISRDVSTDENPPMALKCGHVICNNCVERLTLHSSRFKCPTCPMEQTAQSTQRVYF